MIIPRFSLRWLLGVTTLCALLAYVLAQAIRGQAWGIAISVTVGALLFTSLVHAVVFLLAWGIASAGTGIRRTRATSPFATHVAPPQILPPVDPE
jgi:hypothetical protein